MVIRIRSGRRCDRNLGNNGTCAHRLAYGSDKPITKAECSEY